MNKAEQHTDELYLQLHAVLPRSKANGPGLRFVVWVQGCTLNCPGCFNPETHSFEPSRLASVSELVTEIAASESEIEGITITGGEPLQQPQALLALLEQLRQRTKLTIILLSGYSLAEIDKLQLLGRLRTLVDVLIAGRFRQDQRVAKSLLGSSNKEMVFLTDLYSFDDFVGIPETEVFITAEGISVTGIDPLLFTTVKKG